MHYVLGFPLALLALGVLQWFIIDMLRRADNSNDKALTLLKDWLDPTQLADFKAHNYFFVYGNATGTRYRIRLADSYFNVDEMNTDTSVKQRLCFVCENQVAPGDTMLAQKVMIEQNELHALQIANKSQGSNYGGYAPAAAVSIISPGSGYASVAAVSIISPGSGYAPADSRPNIFTAGPLDTRVLVAL